MTMTHGEFRELVKDENEAQHPDPLARFARLALELVGAVRSQQQFPHATQEHADQMRDRVYCALTAMRDAGFVE